MAVREVHLMQTELIADQRIVRHFCPTCGRCMEDRPDGLFVLVRGDPDAVHRGGSLVDLETELEQDPPPDAGGWTH